VPGLYLLENWMTIFLALLALAAGALLLTKAADWLVTGASALALTFGVTPLVIGLTVVALGTSMPELSTSLQGGSTIAIGNAVGSNLMNIGLILGLTAMVAPVFAHSKFLRFELPIMVAAGPAMLWFTWDGAVSRIEGAILLAGLCAFLIGSVVRGRQDAPREILAEAEEFIPKVPMKKSVAVGLVLIGLIGLVIGGRVLVWGAIHLATIAGISDRIIALTIVAGGTSLPELATCLVAAKKGEPDIALGNVVGSNIFNILGIVGACAVVSPLTVPDGSNTFDIPAVIILQALCVPIMLSGRRIGYREGTVLLAYYAIYIIALFIRK
jgi:cation:H+ antiporter